MIVKFETTGGTCHWYDIYHLTRVGLITEVISKKWEAGTGPEWEVALTESALVRAWYESSQEPKVGEYLFEGWGRQPRADYLIGRTSRELIQLSAVSVEIVCD